MARSIFPGQPNEYADGLRLPGIRRKGTEKGSSIGTGASPWLGTGSQTYTMECRPVLDGSKKLGADDATMRYSVRDLRPLLATPLGRRQFAHGVRHRAWPLYSAAACVYRNTALRNTRFVAVVGSFGKSTTVRAALAALGGDPSRAWPRNAWSSIAQAMLHARYGDRYAVIEVGIDGTGQMSTYARVLSPDIVIVTTIGSEHHRSLGGLEQTRAEKVHMVRQLAGSGLAVLNGDDPNVIWMKHHTPARVVTFGLDEENDVSASHVALDWPRGTRFLLRTRGKSREVRTRLLGTTMVYPVLAAAATALAEGFELDEIVPAIERLPPTPTRLEPVALPSGAYLLRDEFKSSLETVDACLDVFERVPATRKLIVMGEISEPPGSQGPIYRRIGTRMAEMASRVVLVGGNFQRYAAGLRGGGLPSTALVNAKRSALRAAEAIRQELRPGDVVLIKGRDTQRLDRVSLAVVGRRVACDIEFCDAKLRCSECPMLGRGWEGRRVVM